MATALRFFFFFVGPGMGVRPALWLIGVTHFLFPLTSFFFFSHSPSFLNPLHPCLGVFLGSGMLWQRVPLSRNKSIPLWALSGGNGMGPAATERGHKGAAWLRRKPCHLEDNALSHRRLFLRVQAKYAWSSMDVVGTGGISCGGPIGWVREPESGLGPCHYWAGLMILALICMTGDQA